MVSEEGDGCWQIQKLIVFGCVRPDANDIQGSIPFCLSYVQKYGGDASEEGEVWEGRCEPGNGVLEGDDGLQMTSHVERKIHDLRNFRWFGICITFFFKIFSFFPQRIFIASPFVLNGTEAETFGILCEDLSDGILPRRADDTDERWLGANMEKPSAFLLAYWMRRGKCYRWHEFCRRIW